MSLCQVGGANVLGVKNPLGNGVHFLYVKPHTLRRQQSEFPTDTTLFVANIPHIYSEETLKQLFSRFGTVKNVKITNRSQQKHLDLIRSEVYHEKATADDKFLFAHIIFKKPDSVSRACSVTDRPPILSYTNCRPVGIEKEKVLHNLLHPPIDVIKQEIETKVAAYDKKAAERTARMKKARSGPDEDGWTTVIHGRNKAYLEPTEQAIRKKKKRPLEDFKMYQWQEREKKRDQLATLRQKFEEDKKRIATMKLNRKFNPL